MLIPRYSLRWLLGLTTFSAGVSLVLSYAVRGHAWAIGITSALWSLVIVGLFYIAAFLVAWLIAQFIIIGRRGAPRGAGASPFALAKAGQLPLATPGIAASHSVPDTPPPITG
jgi:hypothetical protein